MDYSTTTLGREPYLTEADLGLIHERLEQWRDETRALFEVETQNVTGSQQNVQSDGSEQAQVRDYPIDEFAWSVRALNVLRGMDVRKVSELFEKQEWDFLREPNCGRKTLREINTFKEEFLTNPENCEFINVEVHDPIEELPDWVKSKRIEQYEWSVRTSNVFGHLGIDTVSDLLAYSDAELLRQPNFGRKSLREVNEFKAGIAADPNFESQNRTGSGVSNGRGEQPGILDLTPKTSFQRAGNRTIAEWISDEVEVGENRGLMILADRSGLIRRPLTLEQIGNKQGVTRERIRQIEKKARQKLYTSSDAIQCLHREVEMEIARAKNLPIDVATLAENIPSISDLNDNLDFYTYLFSNLFPGRYIFQIGEMFMLADFPKRDFEAGVSRFEACIRNELIGRSREAVLGSLTALFESSKSLNRAIWLVTSPGCLWGNDDELLSYGRKVTAPVAVMEVMRDALEPMTNEEFTAEVRLRYPHLDPRNVLNRCNHETGVYQFSHLTKGTIKHLPLPEDQHEVLRGYIVEQLEQIGAAQFHSRDLLARLPEQFQRYLSDFTLSAFMRHHELSNYLGRNVFGPEGTQRILLSDIILEVLRDAGRRMHATEILEHVQDRRSVSPTYQIHARGPIVHLGDNYFEYDPTANDQD